MPADPAATLRAALAEWEAATDLLDAIDARARLVDACRDHLPALLDRAEALERAVRAAIVVCRDLNVPCNDDAAWAAGEIEAAIRDALPAALLSEVPHA